jgi:hypothetical protein
MGVSGFDKTGLVQGQLFDQEERERQSRVDVVADQVKERFGAAALGRGSILDREGRPGETAEEA